MGEKRTFAPRVEELEAEYPLGKLIEIYEGVLNGMFERARSGRNAGELARIIESANIRAQVARNRGRLDPDLLKFYELFHEIKYEALLRAVAVRQRHPGTITIGHSIEQDNTGVPYENLTFLFFTAPMNYRTQTSLANLTNKVPDPTAFVRSMLPYDVVKKLKRNRYISRKFS